MDTKESNKSMDVLTSLPYTQIICPVDFSETAMNAIEYAMNLAHTFSTELYIINIKPLLFSQFIGGNADKLRENVLEANRRLAPLCEEAKNKFHISCKSGVIVAHDQLEKIISDVLEEKNLLVMGTNGVDELYQYFFGTNTFKVIQRTMRPVLMIPEEVSYSNLKEATYVLTNKKSPIPLKQVIQFVTPFNAKIHFLYIASNKEPSDNNYLSTINEVEKMLNQTNVRYDFESVYSENVADAIDEYMISKEDNILILPVLQYAIMEAIFKKNSVKKIATTASYPVLFVH
jgi:nucleotide-binding universal stress UspA family protein